MRWIVIAILLAAASAQAAVTPEDFMIILGRNSNASGSSGAGCTNQLVLDYSNSCALIAQAWGQ
jgi:hypothetical protein